MVPTKESSLIAMPPGLSFIALINIERKSLDGMSQGRGIWYRKNIVFLHQMRSGRGKGIRAREVFC